MSRIPLGQATEYPQEYAPEVLFPVARAEARGPLGLGGDLPFHGQDIWNAWELTWLDASGKPVVATATFTVDASSPNVIESKSLKLYLGSLAMTRYDTVADVANVLADDLGRTAGTAIDVCINHGASTSFGTIGELPGSCVDDLPLRNPRDHVDPQLLSGSGDTVAETLHTHLFRSRCPVTNQPDYASVLLRYEGPQIEPTSFLDYIVSFRQHNDFHEACVERMFMDIKERCSPEKLTVYALFTRRGGIDINPFRSDFEHSVDNTRLWRQ